MSVVPENPIPIPPAVRQGGVLVVLGLALALALFSTPAVGVVAFVAGLVVLTRPLDPYLGALLLACTATFVNNEGGFLTRELAVVTAVGMLPLTGWFVAAVTGRWGLPRTRLTLLVLVFAFTTAVALVHGVGAQNPLRFLGLELLPLMMLALSLVVGGVRVSERDRRLALIAFAATALVHVGIGVFSYLTNQVRTGGIYFTPIPGLVALVAVNLALRDESRRVRLLHALLIGLCSLQQLISFTRGYWLGLLAGLMFTIVVYAGWGAGSRRRWARVGAVAGWTSVPIVAGLLVVSLWFGWGDVVGMIFTRLISSVGLTQSSETASNIERLIEYHAAARHIAASPWLGYGLGFPLKVRQPIYLIITSQWYVHETYLWIWLKQGLIGLAAFVALLVGALRLSVRGARRPSGDAAGWCAGAGAATVYMAVLGLTNYPFAQVNSPTMLAVLWGIMLSTFEPVRYSFTWGRPASPQPGAVESADA